MRRSKKLRFSDFINKIDNFSGLTELQKVEVALYFIDKSENKHDVPLKEILDLLANNRCPISNSSRLKTKIKASRHFVKGNTSNTFVLALPAFQDFDSKFSELFQSLDIPSSGLLLDEQKFKINRPNINKLVDQINHCYEYNCYDACAVLMRKLFETVLILAYENLQIANEIKDGTGNYHMLESITGNAKNNSTLNLSREPKKSLDKIRDVGNYSAHNIYYNATKKDIDDINTLYRLVMEELYYKAGFMQEGLRCAS